MAKYTAMDVASVFVRLANSLPDDHVDNMKLNKLCYYAQGWHLARFNTPLFGDPILAWDYGPVIPEVYHAYKSCGKGPIQEAMTEFDELSMSSDELSLLADVYSEYGKYTSSALSNMTHEKGAPWDLVYVPNQNNEISQQSMKEFFSRLNSIDFRLNATPENIVNGIVLEDEEFAS